MLGATSSKTQSPMVGGHPSQSNELHIVERQQARNMSGPTINEQRLKIVNQYMSSGEPWPAGARQIASWAIRKGMWAPQPASLIGRCAGELARAMGQEYYTDPQGRKVRTKHSARISD